jgi:hypothetical protein
MNRRGFLGAIAKAAGAVTGVGVFGLPEVKAAPPPLPPVIASATVKNLGGNDALIPEIWAKEALRVLESNMVTGNLVHGKCESDLRKWSRVNVTKPSGFRKWSRKYD